MNSKQKGNRGEREAAAKFREYGIDAHRTAQMKGKEGGDADIEGVPGLRVEVKRVQKLNLDKAMEQVERDVSQKNNDDIPIVMHRKDRGEWRVTLRFDDFMQIYKEYLNKQEVS